MEDRAWHAAVHGITKSQTRLSDWITASQDWQVVSETESQRGRHGSAQSRDTVRSPSPQLVLSWTLCSHFCHCVHLTGEEAKVSESLNNVYRKHEENPSTWDLLSGETEYQRTKNYHIQKELKKNKIDVTRQSRIKYWIRDESESTTGTSLVAQWLRLHLPVQEVRAWSLVRELKSYMPLGKKPKHKAEAIL